MFYARFMHVDWELGGRKKNLRVGISLNENLLVFGLQETNNSFFRPRPYRSC